MIVNKPSCQSCSCFYSLWPRSLTNSIALGATQAAVLPLKPYSQHWHWHWHWLQPPLYCRVPALQHSQLASFSTFSHDFFCRMLAKDASILSCPWYSRPWSIPAANTGAALRFPLWHTFRLHLVFSLFMHANQKHTFMRLILYWFDSRLF